MRWKRLEGKGNVEDRRRRRQTAAGGLGAIGIIAVLVTMFLGGGGGGLGDVLTDLAASQSGGTSSETVDLDAAELEYAEFVTAILGDLDATWTSIFTASDLTYEQPRLVLFRGFTDSGCGGANEQVGPHYCPLDSTIYIDETFFDEVLERRLGASGGDFAEAYVIAHEVGHHVQKVLGVSDDVREEQRSDPAEANALSVKLELQADCFAGIWAASLAERGSILERGEIREALDAAAAVGDDRIQQKTTGMINEESWTHGSSDERVAWFTAGYDTGNASRCDTFADAG